MVCATSRSQIPPRCPHSLTRSSPTLEPTRLWDCLRGGRAVGEDRSVPELCIAAAVRIGGGVSLHVDGPQQS
jgi:hypothetical protein